PTALMTRLPVGLEEVVADHVSYQERGEDGNPVHVQRLAKYLCPALTMMVLRGLNCVTRTLPRITRVSVPLQRSSTSHLVPRTVAALFLPLVRNRPLPSPQRR